MLEAKGAFYNKVDQGENYSARGGRSDHSCSKGARPRVRVRRCMYKVRVQSHSPSMPYDPPSPRRSTTFLLFKRRCLSLLALPYGASYPRITFELDG